MYNEYLTLDDAHEALAEAIVELNEDRPDLTIDEAYSDLVVMVASQVGPDDVAREFCRTTLGYVPFDLRRRLGDVDWLDS